jgi:hypothetical protein
MTTMEDRMERMEDRRQNNDRRNDIGFKVGISVICSSAVIILGIFFNHTYNTSCRAVELGNANAIINATQDQKLISMDAKLDTILDELKQIRRKEK